MSNAKNIPTIIAIVFATISCKPQPTHPTYSTEGQTYIPAKINAATDFCNELLSRAKFQDNENWKCDEFGGLYSVGNFGISKPDNTLCGDKNTTINFLESQPMAKYQSTQFFTLSAKGDIGSSVEGNLTSIQQIASWLPDVKLESGGDITFKMDFLLENMTSNKTINIYKMMTDNNMLINHGACIKEFCKSTIYIEETITAKPTITITLISNTNTFGKALFKAIDSQSTLKVTSKTENTYILTTQNDNPITIANSTSKDTSQYKQSCDSLSEYYLDQDQDSYGSINSPTYWLHSQQVGFSKNKSDCNDYDNSININRWYKKLSNYNCGIPITQTESCNQPNSDYTLTICDKNIGYFIVTADKIEQKTQQLKQTYQTQIQTINAHCEKHCNDAHLRAPINTIEIPISTQDKVDISTCQLTCTSNNCGAWSSIVQNPHLTKDRIQAQIKVWTSPQTWQLKCEGYKEEIQEIKTPNHKAFETNIHYNTSFTIDLNNKDIDTKTAKINYYIEKNTAPSCTFTVGENAPYCSIKLQEAPGDSGIYKYLVSSQ